MRRLTSETRKSSDGHWHAVQVLPRDVALSDHDRKVLERYKGQLSKALDMTPEKNPISAEATATAVSKMILALGGRANEDLAGQSKGEAYIMALDDVPHWAVEAAIRKWYRGECWSHPFARDENDYRFPPAPAVLRKIAMNASLGQCGWAISKIDRILGAQAATK